MLVVRLGAGSGRIATAVAVVIARAGRSAVIEVESAAVAAVAVQAPVDMSRASSVGLAEDMSYRTCTGSVVAGEGTAGLRWC